MRMVEAERDDVLLRYRRHPLGLREASVTAYPKLDAYDERYVR